jgi:hypothetical protein
MEENLEIIVGYPLTIQHDKGKGKEGYEFVNEEGLGYDIDIEDASYLFEGMSFAEKVKMISLVQANPKSGKDPRIALTMKDAVDREFVKDKNLILNYICSEKDQKQRVRARLFSDMFTRMNINKEYILIKAVDGKSHGGFITHRDNPVAEEIKTWFE